MAEVVLIHHSEIALKGKNRRFFEEKLVENISKALRANLRSIRRTENRIVCKVKDKQLAFDRLLKMPGVASFSFALSTEPKLEAIKKALFKLAEQQSFESFRITVKRSWKGFPLTSLELSKLLGKELAEKLNKKVSLKNFDREFFVEICKRNAFIYCEKHSGLGGLPVNSSGKLIALLSAGIDSSVAPILLMKRGCSITFLHFCNANDIFEHDVAKVLDIVRKLTEFQLESKLYIVPSASEQRQIIAYVPEKLRMLIFRRLIIKTANLLAKQEKASGLMVGDSIGQVASQTLANLLVAYEASEIPIYAPLIGFNKLEIIQLAERFGLYEIAKQPYADCCSLIASKHPETNAKLEELKAIEKNLQLDKLAKACVAKAKLFTFKI